MARVDKQRIVKLIKRLDDKENEIRLSTTKKLFGWIKANNITKTEFEKLLNILDVPYGLSTEFIDDIREVITGDKR